MLLPEALTDEQTISRLQRFGFEYKEKVFFKNLSRRYNNYRYSRGDAITESVLLFTYKGSDFIVRHHQIFGRTGKVFQSLVKVELSHSDPSIYVCEDYQPSPLKTKTKHNLKDFKIHIIAEFCNLFAFPKVSINKTYSDYYSSGEQRFRFYITNNPELETFAFQFVQGHLPPGIFLDALREKLPQAITGAI